MIPHDDSSRSRHESGVLELPLVSIRPLWSHTSAGVPVELGRPPDEGVSLPSPVAHNAALFAFVPGTATVDQTPTAAEERGRSRQQQQRPNGYQMHLPRPHTNNTLEAIKNTIVNTRNIELRPTEDERGKNGSSLVPKT